MTEEEYQHKRLQELIALKTVLVKDGLEAFMLGEGTFDEFKTKVNNLDFVRGLDSIRDAHRIDIVYASHYARLKEDSNEG